MSESLEDSIAKSYLRRILIRELNDDGYSDKIKRVGWFDDKNGVYMELKEDVLTYHKLTDGKDEVLHTETLML